MKRLIIYLILISAAAALPMPVVASEQKPQVDERMQEQPMVKVSGTVIELRSPNQEAVKFQIFSITGQLIKTLTVKAMPVKVELPKGFYIVKCDNWTKRVMLK